MAICPRCRREFEQPQGRGGKSLYCDECKRLRRSEQAMVRGMRVAAIDMAELIEVYGPRLAVLRSKVAERQEKCCAVCGQERKLYLARTSRRYIGLCLADWEKRRLG